MSRISLPRELLQARIIYRLLVTDENIYQLSSLFSQINNNYSLKGKWTDAVARIDST